MLPGTVIDDSVFKEFVEEAKTTTSRARTQPARPDRGLSDDVFKVECRQRLTSKTLQQALRLDFLWPHEL